jgi:hypothetical protein
MCQNKKSELFRRIAAAGCPIDVDLQAPATPEDLIIKQKGDADLFAMGRGGACLSIYMLLASAKGQITVAELGDVIAPWGPLAVTWLDTPSASSQKYRPYQLPNGFEFPREDVLNDKVGEEGKTLRRGEHIEGFALGYTATPIPEAYLDGISVAAEFFVVDVLGREHRGRVQFVVDRVYGGMQKRRASRFDDGLHAPDPRSGPDDCGLPEMPRPRSDRPIAVPDKGETLDQ